MPLESQILASMMRLKKVAGVIAHGLELSAVLLASQSADTLHNYMCMLHYQYLVYFKYDRGILDVHQIREEMLGYLLDRQGRS